MQSDTYYRMFGVEYDEDNDNDEEPEDDAEKLGLNRRRTTNRRRSTNKSRLNKKRNLKKIKKAKYYARLSRNNLNKANTYANNSDMVKARKYEEKAARYAQMSTAQHATTYGRRTASRVKKE